MPSVCRVPLNAYRSPKSTGWRVLPRGNCVGGCMAREPVRDRRRTRGDAELGVDGPYVVLHRLLREEQERGDLSVRMAAGDQRHNLRLARRQRLAVALVDLFTNRSLSAAHETSAA